MNPEKLPYVGIIDTVTTEEYNQARQTIKRIAEINPLQIETLSQLREQLGELGPALYAIGITKGKKNFYEPAYTYTKAEQEISEGVIISLEVERDQEGEEYVLLTVSPHDNPEYDQGTYHLKRGYGVRLHAKKPLKWTGNLNNDAHVYTHEYRSKESFILYKPLLSSSSIGKFAEITINCVKYLHNSSLPDPQTLPPGFSK